MPGQAFQSQKMTFFLWTLKSDQAMDLQVQGVIRQLLSSSNGARGFGLVVSHDYKKFVPKKRSSYGCFSDFFAIFPYFAFAFV